MISYLSKTDVYNLSPRVNSGFKSYKATNAKSLGLIMTRFIWSPIIWDHGIRKAKNFVTAHYCGLDFENPEVSLEDIKRRFCDSWHILGTTRHHQKPKGKYPPMDRFRLLIEFERPINNLWDYKHNMTNIIEHYGADESGADGARIFFPCTQIVSTNTEPNAFAQEVIEAPSEKEYLERIQKLKAQTEHRNSYGRMSSFCEKWLMRVIPEGKRNDTCFALGCEMSRQGIEYEDAVGRLLRSPTYAGHELSSTVIKAIRSQVKSGYSAALRSLADGSEKAKSPPR